MNLIAAVAYQWHWREDDLLGYPLWQLAMLQDALHTQLKNQSRR